MFKKESKMNSTTIKIPNFLSLYFFSRKKLADIDFQNNMITTIIDDVSVEQKFFKVNKVETFQAIKYVLPLFAIVTSDYYTLSISNGLSLMFAALTLILWPKFRHANPKKLAAIGASITASILLTAPFALFGIVPGFAILILMKLYGTGWAAIALFEIMFGFDSKEYLRMRKVYVDGLPKVFCHYFVVEPAQPQTFEFKKKLKVVATTLAIIGFVILSYSSFIAIKNYKAASKARENYKQYEKITELKKQADQNGSVQIVTTLTKEKLDPKIQKMRETLDIKPTYSKTIITTYPWEKGYQRAGQFTIEDGKIVSEIITKSKK